MSRNDDMTIRFSGLKPGVYNYGFTLTDEFFEAWKNEEIVGGKVEIAAEMERLERMLMIKFSLQGSITVPCDRCLAPLTLPIEGTEQLCVRFSDTETTDDEDVAVLPEDAFEIDLSQWLYEYVAVRIPMQHSHSEGECDPEMTRYIDSDDEQDERPADNEPDPRWDALRALRDKEQ
jgi:uncharacterized metal-binding protein YceD (DUF177 family)